MLLIRFHPLATSAAKISRLLERGERITIARAGRPFAIIAPVPPDQRPPLPPDDPLLNLEKFGFDGPGGKLTSAEIDRIVCGA